LRSSFVIKKMRGDPNITVTVESLNIAIIDITIAAPNMTPAAIPTMMMGTDLSGGDTLMRRRIGKVDIGTSIGGGATAQRRRKAEEKRLPAQS
jgi:hypothetical protein